MLRPLQYKRVGQWFPRLLAGALVSLFWVSPSASAATPAATQALASAPAATACVPGPGRWCLTQGRFQVTAAWRTPEGQTGQGSGPLSLC